MNLISITHFNVKLHKIDSNLSNSNNHLVIAGKTKKLNITLPCVVRLYERISGNLVESTWSDIEGSYSFFNLNKNTKYYVMAMDPKSQFNAVIQDNVVPK